MLPVTWHLNDEHLKVPRKLTPKSLPADFDRTEIILSWYKEGFLEFALDSIAIGDQIDVYAHPGKRYEWGTIRRIHTDMPPPISRAQRLKRYQNDRISPASISKLMQQELEHYENHGYPFCAIRLDSIEIKDASVSAVLLVHPGKPYRIDSIIIKNSSGRSINQQLVENTVGIRTGSAFSQEKLDAIPIRLKETPFLRQVKPYALEFTAESCKLYLFIESSQASFVNGILGVLPDPDNNKVTITGDARLSLKNALGRGELIDINWRRLQTRTQDLTVHLNYPFIFNTPFAPDGYLKIYRRDSTFSEVTARIGFDFLLPAGSSLNGNFERRIHTLLQPEQYEGFNNVPPQNDATVNLYNIGINLNRLDYRLNPRKGFRINGKAGAGTKNILPNPNVDTEVYEDTDLRTNQYNGQLDLEVFIPIGKRMTLLNRVQAAGMFSESIFRNELFRIGGLRIMRGFDEESIQASSYAIGSLEFRFLLEQNSYVYAFTDVGWYEQLTTDVYTKDTPYSFGAGIAFQTGVGIFTINTAVGAQQGNSPAFRSAKVHFGFINYF